MFLPDLKLYNAFNNWTRNFKFYLFLFLTLDLCIQYFALFLLYVHESAMTPLKISQLQEGQL